MVGGGAALLRMRAGSLILMSRYSISASLKKLRLNTGNQLVAINKRWILTLIRSRLLDRMRFLFNIISAWTNQSSTSKIGSGFSQATLALAMSVFNLSSDYVCWMPCHFSLFSNTCNVSHHFCFMVFWYTCRQIFWNKYLIFITNGLF